MKAVTWHGNHDVRVDNVPDPTIEHPTDAIIRVTSSGICGSDLHLYEVLGPFLDAGDILGHEPMGVVEAVGAEVTNLKPGDRVVIPFNISCGHCHMCGNDLQSQCETTQVHEYGTGAAFLGYTKLYGQVAGGQAEYLRVPHADYGAMKVPDGPADDRFLYLSDVLPTAWQGVEYADVPEGGTIAILGLGPIGEMAARVAQHRGAGQVIGIDLVPDRLARAAAHGVTALNLEEIDDLPEAVRGLTDGRGPIAVLDAVGMEAHGAPIGRFAHLMAGMLPDAIAQKVMETAGIDRLTALHMAMELVQRGGTVSISGVYGGAASPMPLLQMFDKQLTIRMGQANVRRWTDTLMPLLTGDDDPLGVDDFATHHVPLADAPQAYETFQKKQDGAFKVILKP
ncbi:glutathione-dependent formaldehyde dehydrogenase [Paraconexibacter antarcticus]|uniref:Glutathione-dependent formaldehyde dehydrogenase n=1 Tax=Paraconexibacter antarcticus TaxID=2949664 RepID=A0ABY5DP26_9ACTN|nr:zinc-dependent alcohol dehydrogenase [Paraconexibacter antarcticus]UTI63783.1 glutathione-dependent formaldehyde dehydrogenase [Paraconexibacter antarcticus]